MALKIKSAAEAADKLVVRAQASATEYGREAGASGDSWAANTIAAKDSFGQAITAAGIKDRFARGVAKAGAAKYARKVKEVGADRFSPGVAAGKVDYQANVEPFFATIANLTLSARQPRGSAANYNRVGEVGKALNAKRLALLGAGA